MSQLADTILDHQPRHGTEVLMSREWDKRAAEPSEHQGGIVLHPFFRTRLGCATLIAIMAAAACVPWLIKVAFGF